MVGALQAYPTQSSARSSHCDEAGKGARVSHQAATGEVQRKGGAVVYAASVVGHCRCGQRFARRARGPGCVRRVARGDRRLQCPSGRHDFENRRHAAVGGPMMNRGRGAWQRRLYGFHSRR